MWEEMDLLSLIPWWQEATPSVYTYGVAKTHYSKTEYKLTNVTTLGKYRSLFSVAAEGVRWIKQEYVCVIQTKWVGNICKCWSIGLWYSSRSSLHPLRRRESLSGGLGFFFSPTTVIKGLEKLSHGHPQTDLNTRQFQSRS